MRQLFGLLLDWLGIAQVADVDEHAAHLAVAVAVLRSDLEDLRARVDEFEGVKPVEDVR